jgi:predicted HTH transcriptional regulator
VADALPSSIEQIDAWRNAPSETQHLEFKEARTQFEHSQLREYRVAFANEGGGHLLLGITDAPPRERARLRRFGIASARAGMPHRSNRSLIANALIHQDLRTYGGQ